MGEVNLASCSKKRKKPNRQLETVPTAGKESLGVNS